MAARIRSPSKLGQVMIRMRISMHERKHFIFVGPGAILDPILTERFRRASPALIKSGNEAWVGLHLLKLLLIEIATSHNSSFDVR